MNIKRVILLAVALLGTITLAVAVEVKGSVCTTEGNGIEGVVVTDGYNFAQTDQQGNFTIEVDRRARHIYISTPSGYLVENKGSIPQFFLPVSDSTESYDFTLTENPNDDTRHTFFATADVQATSKEDLARYATIAEDMGALAKSVGGDYFSVDCGDIVGDSPWLYPHYLEVADAVGIPVWRILGNHDMNYYGKCFETSYKTFEDIFAPNYYSMNRGKAHYIFLNNNFYVGREYFYMGYYTEALLEWLEKDLSYVPEDGLVFVIQHIPARLSPEQAPFEYNGFVIAEQTTNAGALFELLKGHKKSHIISGHMHYNLNLEHVEGPMEHNSGSVCGTWWRGDVCLDGTPMGYGVYEVDGTDVSWYYKASGREKEYQLRAYKPGSKADQPSAVVANVWNYDSKWSVELYEDGKKTADMTQFEGYDRAAYELCSDKEKVVYAWISPVPTSHLFWAEPKNPNAKIEVRATDRFGRTYIASLE
ncbi:MAG: calcineurin-like phosphoesterase C-terminal domain-containing protein [Tidjanibacter sp.]|nr:calcineurin-like phosphoesterase C-terminal domain-containing protein [Tidjanibacter sp.]